MNIKIIAIAKLKNSPLKDLIDDYQKRINRWNFEIIEIETKDNYSKEKEAELIIAKIPDSSFVIALDERGKDISSKDLSAKIQWTELNNYKNLVFAIGGSDGHGESLRNRADLKIAMGKMTWPHMMARAMIVEQIYRSQQIINNHPYHK